MDYFNILNLIHEPFSNAPDPDFFYRSRQHVTCLQQVEISLRLRRGLNVVVGDVGIGKTTICRRLIRRLGRNRDTETFLILDPDFKTPEDFVRAVAEKLDDTHRPDAPLHLLRESVKRHLFEKGVSQNKNLILIIDEGQKMPDFCLELLREFLNYETNSRKLLQIVIFAQKEFKKKLKAHTYFADRINFYHELKPLSFRETRGLISYRLNRASDASKQPPRFSFLAQWTVYQASDGYPRKIVNLCHQCLLALIIKQRRTADVFLVRSCIKKLYPHAVNRWRLVLTSTAAILAAALLVGANVAPDGLKTLFSPTGDLIRATWSSMAAGMPEPSRPRAVRHPVTQAAENVPGGPCPGETNIPAPDETVFAPTPGTGGEDMPPSSGPPAAPVATRPEAAGPLAETRRADTGNPLPDPSGTEIPDAEASLPAVAAARHAEAPYSVQIGAFIVEANARELYTRFRGKGYPAYTFSAVDEKGRRWTAVRIGRFHALDRAAEMARKLYKTEQTPSFIVHTNSLRAVAKRRLDR